MWSCVTFTQLNLKYILEQLLLDSDICQFSCFGLFTWDLPVKLNQRAFLFVFSIKSKVTLNINLPHYCVYSGIVFYLIYLFLFPLNLHEYSFLHLFNRLKKKVFMLKLTLIKRPLCCNTRFHQKMTATFKLHSCSFQDSWRSLTRAALRSRRLHVHEFVVYQILKHFSSLFFNSECDLICFPA